MSQIKTNSKVVVALDHERVADALSFVSKLDPSVCRLKVGNILFTQSGPKLVEKLISLGYDVFLDLKYHDIPNTVVGAVKAAADMGVWMLNVHISGGRPMLEALHNWMAGQTQRPICIGVTILTSLEAQDLELFGCARSVEDMVLRLAQRGKECGLDGVVCSAHEALMLKNNLGDDFILVTPGIRTAANHQDQARVMTPVAAINAGSDFLVMGRDITNAPDPLSFIIGLNESIK